MCEFEQYLELLRKSNPERYLSISLSGDTAWLTGSADLLTSPVFQPVFSDDERLRDFARHLFEAILAEVTGLELQPTDGITPENVIGGLISTLQDLAGGLSRNPGDMLVNDYASVVANNIAEGVPRARIQLLREAYDVPVIT